MDKLWSIILQTSIYGSIVGIVILICKQLIKNNINAKYSYLMWILLIIKLIIPFGPESEISIFNKISAPSTYEENINNNQVNIESINQDIENSNPKSYINQYTVKIDNTSDYTIKTNNFKSYLPTIWLIGFVNVFSVFVFSYFILSKKIKRESNKVGYSIYNILESSKSKIKTKSNLQILSNDFISTPSLVGLINPKVIIPSNLISLSEKELEYIILHELSHHKRKDMLMNYILIILQSIHWYNPFIWYLFKKIREDMELATDELALKVIKDEEHLNYGKTILTVLERIRFTNRNIGIIGMIDDKKTIKKRIEMIRNMRFVKSKKVLFSIVGITSILILSSILLTSANGKEDIDKLSYAKSLYEHKSPYIGDASNVDQLLAKLPYGSNKTKIELKTKNEPYSLIVSYEFKNESKDDIQSQMYSNAVIVLSLIENLEYIEFDINSANENNKLEYKKDNLNKDFHQLITQKSEDIKSFTSLVEYLEENSKGNKSLDKAISNVLINAGIASYRESEVMTEGHVILDKEKKDNFVKVYLITSTGSFGFENEVFTLTSGTSRLPVVLTFEIDNEGNYKYIDSEVPLDGALYEETTKDLFPKELWNDVFNSEKYSKELVSQQEEQAKAYLKSINREAKVQADYVEKELVNIDVEASNKLFEIEQLLNYPYWIGTREELINGERFVYEKSNTKKDGYDYVTYTKKKADKVIEEYKYKIVGNEIEGIK